MTNSNQATNNNDVAVKTSSYSNRGKFKDRIANGSQLLLLVLVIVLFFLTLVSYISELKVPSRVTSTLYGYEDFGKKKNIITWKGECAASKAISHLQTGISDDKALFNYLETNCRAPPECQVQNTNFQKKCLIDTGGFIVGELYGNLLELFGFFDNRKGSKLVDKLTNITNKDSWYQFMYYQMNKVSISRSEYDMPNVVDSAGGGLSVSFVEAASTKDFSVIETFEKTTLSGLLLQKGSSQWQQLRKCTDTVLSSSKMKVLSSLDRTMVAGYGETLVILPNIPTSITYAGGNSFNCFCDFGSKDKCYLDLAKKGSEYVRGSGGHSVYHSSKLPLVLSTSSDGITKIGLYMNMVYVGEKFYTPSLILYLVHVLGVLGLCTYSSLLNTSARPASLREESLNSYDLTSTLNCDYLTREACKRLSIALVIHLETLIIAYSYGIWNLFNIGVIAQSMGMLYVTWLLAILQFYFAGLFVEFLVFGSDVVASSTVTPIVLATLDTIIQIAWAPSPIEDADDTILQDASDTRCDPKWQKCLLVDSVITNYIILKVLFLLAQLAITCFCTSRMRKRFPSTSAHCNCKAMNCFESLLMGECSWCALKVPSCKFSGNIIWTASGFTIISDSVMLRTKDLITYKCFQAINRIMNSVVKSSNLTLEIASLSSFHVENVRHRRLRVALALEVQNRPSKNCLLGCKSAFEASTKIDEEGNLPS